MSNAPQAWLSELEVEERRLALSKHLSPHTDPARITALLSHPVIQELPLADFLRLARWLLPDSAFSWSEFATWWSFLRDANGSVTVEQVASQLLARALQQENDHDDCGDHSYSNLSEVGYAARYLSNMAGLGAEFGIEVPAEVPVPEEATDWDWGPYENDIRL